MFKTASIKVGVKIKPNKKEKAIVSYEKNNLKNRSINLIVQSNEESKKFEIDSIHDANVSKQTTFSNLHIDNFVQKFLKGFNVTVMAYGQTGAGKTYCMEGNSLEPGIITQSIQMIFENKNKQTQVKCSYVQVYNEKLYDLLNDETTVEDNLKLRWQIERDFIVEDLSFQFADSAKQMQKIFKKGTKNRVVASNKIHQLSSRSHAIFTITLSDHDESNNFRQRQMIFVDLAGSERLFDRMGKLSKESIQINKSLFVLRKVIKSLEESTLYQKELYVPYRQSKLTSILKKAFGGNCITMMIACIDATQKQKDQTLSTLSYAVSAGHIRNTAKVNIDHQALENRHLKHENQKLRKELQTAMKQIDIMHKRQKTELEKKTMNEYSHKIIQCIGTIRQLIKSNKELREDLDEERRVRRQQKMQIEMLMDENQNIKKINNSVLYDIPELPKKLPYQHEKERQQLQLPYKSIRIKQSIPKIERLKSNSNIVKRKKYILHKTQPDQMLSEKERSYRNLK